jgi:hypothetical protein
MGLGEVIMAVVGRDLQVRGRMDMGLGDGGEVQGVGVLGRVLEREYQVVNGGEESVFLKGHRAEAAVGMEEVLGEGVEADIDKSNTMIPSNTEIFHGNL